jgi:hypothetical protein
MGGSRAPVDEHGTKAEKRISLKRVYGSKGCYLLRWCLSAALMRPDSKTHKTTLFRWPLAIRWARDLGLGLKCA